MSYMSYAFSAKLVAVSLPEDIACSWNKVLHLFSYVIRNTKIRIILSTRSHFRRTKKPLSNEKESGLVCISSMQKFRVPPKIYTKHHFPSLVLTRSGCKNPEVILRSQLVTQAPLVFICNFVCSSLSYHGMKKCQIRKILY